MGRPRAIQGEVRDRLLYALEQGTPISLACQYAGVAESIYYRECEQNGEFRDAATRARARKVPEALATIYKAGQDDWRASAEFLKLSHRPAFAQQVELTSSEPLKISLDFGGAAPARELTAGALEATDAKD